MGTVPSLSTPLSPVQVRGLCALAVALHVLPLIIADYPYIDDIWRSQSAGLGDDGRESWTGHGRFLLAWLYQLLSVSGAAPNLFPLPLLLGAGVCAMALASLARHYHSVPSASSVLVVLPLWFNPFFLQGLSYQYDGAGMALALAACIWAITLTLEPVWKCLAGALLVAVAASFYQVSVNVFAGLCCVEVMRQVLGQASLRQVCRHALGRLGQLLGGCGLYYLTAFQLIDVPRTALLPVDGAWLPAMRQRLSIIADHVLSLLTPGPAWLFIGLLLLALIALMAAVREVSKQRRSMVERALLAAFLLLPLAPIVLLVHGMMLLFASFDDGARSLQGFGVLMVTLMLLAHRLLTSLQARLAWLLAVPLLFMLSFSYAYGRVLVVQKTLQQTVGMALAQRIQSQPALYDAQRLFMLDSGSSGQWLAGAHGSYEAMPALRYVLNVNFLLLPEMMPRFGVSNFGSHPALDREQVLAQSPAPLVDDMYYAIHKVGGTVYVLMKAPKAPEAYRW
ncbi:glucosyltransferase domain-containing protein [Pseudomonas sp. SMSB3]|uniref:glucosyltransferase domain-containing protein n=1 Tax=Pseudomonas sp. SMSB3 TaxID=3390196 RepID=UPI003F827E8B